MKGKNMLLLLATVLLTTTYPVLSHEAEPSAETEASCSSPDEVPTHFPTIGRWRVSPDRLTPWEAHLPLGAQLFFEDFHQTGKDVVLVPKPQDLRAVKLAFQCDLDLPTVCDDDEQSASYFSGEANWHPQDVSQTHTINVYVYNGGTEACIVTSHRAGGDHHDGAAHTHENP